MSDSSTTYGEHLPDSFWDDLTRIVADTAVVEPPYKQVRVYQDVDTGDYHGVVTAPRPDPPEADADTSDENALGIPTVDLDEYEENQPTALTGTVQSNVADLVDALTQTIEIVGEDPPEFTITPVHITLEPDRAAVSFELTRPLPPDSELYSEFQDLMVALDHVDNATDATHGHGLHPETRDDGPDHDDFPGAVNPVNLGMAATAYTLVEDPHTYWADCDSLQDFIDMCVDNGGDRAELEARDEYYHHFHPETTYRELTSEEQTALQDWQSAVRETVTPYISLSGPVISNHVTDVAFTEATTGHVEVRITVGDEIR